MKYKINRSTISGNVYVPPSKSHTLRALVFALMAEGKSKIRNYLPSPDTNAMINAITHLGAVTYVTAEYIEVEGVGGRLKRPLNVIDAGNSGLVFRFIAGISALLDSYVIITGDESIRLRRPIFPLLNALSSQDVFAVSAALNDHAPIIIKGPLKNGTMALEGGDSQPVSALLIATSFLEGPSEIFVTNPGEKPWIDLTIKWLKDFGVHIENENYQHYRVPGNAKIKGFDITIPGDFSSAAYSIVASMITGGELKVFGLDPDDKQADRHFLTLLKKMGAEIEFRESFLSVSSKGELKGMEIDINDCIDQIPLLAVVGCYSSSPLTIKGGQIARLKESDRIHTITMELRKMGARIEETVDGMIVSPSRLKGAKLFSHNDHRIALSLITAAFSAEGESTIDGVECMEKTYPSFQEDFAKLNGAVL